LVSWVVVASSFLGFCLFPAFLLFVALNPILTLHLLHLLSWFLSQWRVNAHSMI
jgi:hypothetical protein